MCPRAIISDFEYGLSEPLPREWFLENQDWNEFSLLFADTGGAGHPDTEWKSRCRSPLPEEDVRQGRFSRCPSACAGRRIFETQSLDDVFQG